MSNPGRSETDPLDANAAPARSWPQRFSNPGSDSGRFELVLGVAALGAMAVLWVLVAVSQPTPAGLFIWLTAAVVCAGLALQRVILLLRLLRDRR